MPCGVYDPAQARIAAKSVKAMQEKYQGNEDPTSATRAIVHQGAARRAVKDELDVLWTDYFKPPPREATPACAS